MKTIIREIEILFMCFVSSMTGIAFFEVNAKLVGSIQCFIFIFGWMCILAGWRFEELGICLLLVSLAIAAIHTLIFEITYIVETKDGKENVPSI